MKQHLKKAFVGLAGVNNKYYTLLRAVSQTAHEYMFAQRGATAVKFTLCIIPILAVIGMTIDITRAHSVKSQMQDAADAAALAGRLEMAKNPRSWKTTVNEVVMETTTDIEFKGRPKIETTNPDSDSVNVRVEAQVKPYFAQIMGYPKLDVAVESTVRSSAGAPYVTVTFLIDQSNSMGIGASTTDINRMVSATGCAFACHYDDSGVRETYSRSRAIGVKLRIDVVKKGLLEAIDELEANEGFPDAIEVSAFTFGNEIHQILAPTTDFEDMRDGMNKVEFSNHIDFFGTNLTQSIIDLSNTLPRSGDGSSPQRRRSVVVLITDSIEDNTYTTSNYVKNGNVLRWVDNPKFRENSSRYQDIQVPKPNYCDPLKKLGHEVIPVQVEYIVPRKGVWGADAPFFRFIENSLLEKSAERAETCSSDGKYYHASKPADIRAAISEVGKNIGTSTDLYISN